jgi:hypothetical protein
MMGNNISIVMMGNNISIVTMKSVIVNMTTMGEWQGLLLG